MLLRKKLSYIESIPGVLLPHPSSAAYPFKIEAYPPEASWHYQNNIIPPNEYYDHPLSHHPMRITPSMSSLEALLSKLPSVAPPSSSSFQPQTHPTRPMDLMGVAKEEYDDDDDRNVDNAGESSAGGGGSMAPHDNSGNVKPNTDPTPVNPKIPNPHTAAPR